jgi:hypothetical protein
LLLLLAAAGLAIAGSFSLSRKALLACGILLGIYALASLAASAVSARQNGWRLFPCLPLTFAVFHISYGLGFLIGSAYWTFSRSARSRLGDLFVGVTR